VRNWIGLAALGGSVSLTVAAAADITFSFASDSNADGPTFFGGFDEMKGNHILDGEDHDDDDGDVIVGLIVDENGDAPGGDTTLSSVFSFEAMTTSYSVAAFDGGFVHQWTAEGFFTFTQTGTGLEVLRIRFENALFTSWSANQFELGTTASLQSSTGIDPELEFHAGEALIAQGITDADISTNEGFGFSLTNIRSAEFPGLPLHLFANGDFAHHWISEGSFSATAAPCPGAWVLVLGGFLPGARRRRLA
jgi:hypothetical protein